MQQLLSISIQKRIAIGVMAIALLFGMMDAAQPAQAQAPTQNDLQAQIAQLLQMVSSLQAQVEELKSGSSGSDTSLEGGFTDRNISVGALIQTTDSLKVRASGAASGALLEVQNPFSRGTVIAGPRAADGYTWWQIRYANGRVGWSAENWLRGRAAAPTADVPSDKEEQEEEGVDDVASVKCTIESSKRVVTRGDRFEIDWHTNLNNPIMLDEKGERSVTKSGTRRYVARTEGVQQYAIINSEGRIACSVDITVIAEEDKEDEKNKQAALQAKINDLISQIQTNHGEVQTPSEEDVGEMTEAELQAQIDELSAKLKASKASQVADDERIEMVQDLIVQIKNDSDATNPAMEEIVVQIEQLLPQIDDTDKKSQLREQFQAAVVDVVERTSTEEVDETKIELADIVLQMAVGLESPDLKYDVDNNGEVTVGDSLNIGRVALGMAPSAPATTEKIQALIDEWEQQQTVNSLSDVVMQMGVGIIPSDMKYDVNQSGGVTVADALEIVRVEVGLSPVTGDASEIQVLIDEWNNN